MWIEKNFIRIWTCLDLNCLFFEADSKYELENIDFQFFWFFSLTHTVHVQACMRWRSNRGDDHEILLFLASKSYQNINVDQIKNKDINLMIIYLIFFQNCNFLAIHVDARSWNGDLLLSSVESSRCAATASWQALFWKLELRSNKLVD